MKANQNKVDAPRVTLDTILERVGLRDKPKSMLVQLGALTEQQDWDKLSSTAKQFYGTYATQQSRIQTDADFIDESGLINQLSQNALPATSSMPLVQTEILGVIALLSRHPSNEEHCIENVGFTIKALTTHADERLLQRKGLRILAQLGDSDLGLDSIASAGTLCAISQLLQLQVYHVFAFQPLCVCMCFHPL
jgi:hypothetical protein